jgi:hypothetical protein
MAGLTMNIARHYPFFGAEAKVAFYFAFKWLAGGVACLNLSYKYGVCLPACTPSRDAFNSRRVPQSTGGPSIIFTAPV